MQTPMQVVNLTLIEQANHCSILVRLRETGDVVLVEMSGMKALLQDSLDDGLYGGGYQRRADSTGGLLDIERLVQVILSRKWTIAFSGFIFTLSFAVYALTLPTVYASSAKIVLNTREAAISDLKIALSGLQANSTTLDSELQILSSPELVARVVDRLDLVNDPEFNPPPTDPSLIAAAIQGARAWAISLVPATIIALLTPDTAADDDGGESIADSLLRQEVADAVKENISVTQLGTASAVFMITAVSENRVKAATIANALAEQYIEDQLRVKLTASRRASEWLGERVIEMKLAAEKAEQDLQTHLSIMSAGAEDSIETKRDQLAVLRRRIETASEALNETVVRHVQLAALLNSGDVVAAARFATRTDGAAVGAPASGESDPDALRAKAEAVRAKLEEKISLDTANLAILERAAQQTADAIEVQTQSIVRRQQLEREAEISRNLYEAFLTRLQESAEQDSVQSADASIFARAMPSPSPAGPNRARIAILGGALGVFLMTALIAARDLLRKTFRSLESLELATGLPILGAIPFERRGHSTKRLLQLVQGNKTNALAESIRSILTAVDQKQTEAPIKIIMLTSTTPLEGKSSTTLMMAAISAENGKKVIILDCDFRRMAISRAIKNKKVSFVNIMNDPSQLDRSIVFDEVNKTYHLSFTVESKGYVSIFSSNKFSELLRILAQEFDHVYIDTPPVLSATDARLIAKHVDGVIYLVRWDCTEPSNTLLGLRKISDSGAYIVGTVATMVKEDSALPSNIRALTYQTYGNYYNS